jgi:hypothetical protein
MNEAQSMNKENTNSEILYNLFIFNVIFFAYYIILSCCVRNYRKKYNSNMKIKKKNISEFNELLIDKNSELINEAI